MIDQKLRDDMLALYGMFNAISLPLVWNATNESQAYYDLIDNMLEQYKSILSRLFKDFDDD